MSKGARIEKFVSELGSGSESLHSPFYSGYFECFNDGRYYEAHDVLEHLWLRDRHNLFYKGLIQVAGGFVHLQKQALRPWHAKDGKRLRPAAKLFALGIQNLRRYPSHHESLDVSNVIALCELQIKALEKSNFELNPWNSDHKPQLRLMV